MALTALQAYIRRPEPSGSNLPFDELIEYSRNEENYAVIRMFVMTTPTDATQAGEEITVRIYKARRDRDEEVVQARRVFTIPAGVMPTQGYEFQFDLRRIVYSSLKPFPIMRRGNYFFRVEHTGGTTGPSAVTDDTQDFRVAPMTVNRLENEWIFGATRRSNDDRALRFQPRTMTGVRVVEVSKNHPLDLYPLALALGAETPTAKRFLSWDQGLDVEVDMSIPDGIDRQYVLPGVGRESYVIIQVDPLALPNANTTEMLMVDRQLIGRESLRRWIDEEATWVEKYLIYTPIDPALIVSDFDLTSLNVGPGAEAGAPSIPENFDYDIMAPPVSYYPPGAGHWIKLRLPYWKPLSFDYLIGALENTRIVDISVDWIHKTASGWIQLVPFNQSLAFHFIGLMYISALRGPVELPSFWRYRYYAGLEEDTTPFDILEVIGMRAAVKALAVLGQAFRGGFSSQSVSRDGVSESVGYTASARYGIYSATIEEYKKRLEPLEKQVGRRYYGFTLEAM